MLRKMEGASTKIVMEMCFWTITLGVIIFFVFILFERFIPQIFVTSALFLAVVTVFFLYASILIFFILYWAIFTKASSLVYLFLSQNKLRSSQK